MPPRPLHKDSPMEEWDARRRTLAADEFLLNLFFPTAVSVTEENQ